MIAKILRPFQTIFNLSWPVQNHLKFLMQKWLQTLLRPSKINANLFRPVQNYTPNSSSQTALKLNPPKYNKNTGRNRYPSPIFSHVMFCSMPFALLGKIFTPSFFLSKKERWSFLNAWNLGTYIPMWPFTEASPPPQIVLLATFPKLKGMHSQYQCLLSGRMPRVLANFYIWAKFCQIQTHTYVCTRR